MQCMEGYDYLMDLGGNCDSPKHKCTRVSCSDNCGIFLCNKVINHSHSSLPHPILHYAFLEFPSSPNVYYSTERPQDLGPVL